MVIFSMSISAHGQFCYTIRFTILSSYIFDIPGMRQFILPHAWDIKYWLT